MPFIIDPVEDVVTPEGWQPGDAVLMPPKVRQDAIPVSAGGDT